MSLVARAELEPGAKVIFFVLFVTLYVGLAAMCYDDVAESRKQSFNNWELFLVAFAPALFLVWLTRRAGHSLEDSSNRFLVACLSFATFILSAILFKECAR